VREDNVYQHSPYEMLSSERCRVLLPITIIIISSSSSSSSSSSNSSSSILVITFMQGIYNYVKGKGKKVRPTTGRKGPRVFRVGKGPGFS
jgi:hypothetical protein